jgi:hypothetical protein
VNDPCGCFYGGDCTKTTVCAIDGIREDLEEQAARLEWVIEILMARLREITDTIGNVSETEIDEFVRKYEDPVN